MINSSCSLASIKKYLYDDLISAFEVVFIVLSRLQMVSQPRFEINDSITLEAK